MHKPVYPNLLIIGAMKSGTTSLHHYLNQHPDIHMSAVKETNFFVNRNLTEQDKSNYRLLFNGDYKINGESSQAYTRLRFHKYRHIPENIYNCLNEKVKMINIIRDPIIRICSHLFELIAQGHIVVKDMNRFFQTLPKLDQSDYVKTSSYYFQVKPYVDLFPPQNILLLQMEDLIARPGYLFQHICYFLNKERLAVDSLPVKNQSNQKVNPTRLQKISKRLVEKLPIDNAGWLENENNPFLYKNIQYPDKDFSAETIWLLKSLLAEDVKKLQGQFTINPSMWPLYSKN